MAIVIFERMVMERRMRRKDYCSGCWLLIPIVTIEKNEM